MYRVANCIIGITTFLALAFLAGSLYSQKESLIIIASAIIGFCSMPSYLVSFTYWTEISFRTKETTSWGFFLLGVNISSLAIAYLATGILDLIDSKYGGYFSIAILMLFTMIGGIASVFMPPVKVERPKTIRHVVTNSYAFRKSWISDVDYYEDSE